MTRDAERYERVFKTAWFSKAAKKAHIRDAELCVAIRQVMLGQADDLGGGVWKKRLGKNLYRSIILARGRGYWVYEYLFAKQDRANITQDELTEFRVIAKDYASLPLEFVEELIHNKQWTEICNGKEA
jgi:hypothetical protein